MPTIYLLAIEPPPELDRAIQGFYQRSAGTWPQPRTPLHISLLPPWEDALACLDALIAKISSLTESDLIIGLPQVLPENLINGDQTLCLSVRGLWVHTVHNQLLGILATFVPEIALAPYVGKLFTPHLTLLKHPKVEPFLLERARSNLPEFTVFRVRHLTLYRKEEGGRFVAFLSVLLKRQPST